METTQSFPAASIQTAALLLFMLSTQLYAASTQNITTTASLNSTISDYAHINYTTDIVTQLLPAGCSMTGQQIHCDQSEEFPVITGNVASQVSHM